MHQRPSAAVSSFDPNFGTASQAARAIQAGVISARELTEHTYNRIKQYNPRLNAFVTLIEEQAMLRARHADEALAAGRVWGPLHGVPIVIKDAFATAGVRTTAGAKTLEHHLPTEDAVAVTRLTQAGAIMLGKTNLPAFSGDQQSYNDVVGTTNNPWDLTKTPGGSTGGGATALAAGLGFLELGGDFGGSIRNPAHFCGVYGHKPTFDVVPRHGYIPPLSDPFSVVGPLARSAQDLQMMLAIVGGPMPAEARASHWTLPAARGVRWRDYCLGYVLDDPFCPVTSEVAEVLAQALDALRKQGVELREGWPQGVDPHTLFAHHFFLTRARDAATLTEEQLDALRAVADRGEHPYARQQWEAVTASSKEYLRRDAARLEARALWAHYFQTHDAFLMPVNFVAAFAHDHHPDRLRLQRWIATSEGPRPFYDLVRWISFATFTGCPATVAPVGRTKERLPVGMQILGPFLEDATPIAIAGLMADVVGGFEPPPGYAG